MFLIGLLFAVALMIGIGTMIGYKKSCSYYWREKIGSKPINQHTRYYSQRYGYMITILLANLLQNMHL